MTTTTARAPTLLLLGGALLAVYGVCAVLATSMSSLRSPEAVAAGIAFDLTATATALVWWLGSRRGALPRWAPLTTLILGVTLASQVPHAPVRVLTAAGIAFELVLLGVIAARLPTIVRAARAARMAGPLGALEAGFTAARVPSRLGAILASELGVVWLAVTGWVRRAEPASFSMRRTSWLSVAGLLGFLIAVESVAVHLLLAMWSPIAAWIATASSAYALLWLIADSHAIRLFPVAVSEGTLWIRIGVRWRAEIPLTAIASATEISSLPAEARNLALIDPSVLVELRAPVELRGPFGIRRQAQHLALTIDDPARFLAAVRPKLERAAAAPPQP